MKRAPLIFGGLAVVLLGVNANILHKERILASGTTMLLELAPVDPRSLMQGDYMVLRYAVADQARSRDDIVEGAGALVVVLDARGVASFERPHAPDGPLNSGEHLLRYKARRGMVRLGAESFFFQEGHRERYASARFGELRVAENGKSVLVGLRDAALQPLH